MPRYRRRSSDEDQATPEGGAVQERSVQERSAPGRLARGRPADFTNVENRRHEPFPEEFPEGAVGAPPRREDIPPAGANKKG